ncbi:MAG: twin-arginine translocation signal domain-containing protein [Planctomycetes bacterium]|nr:twin-arginine translocation signal domain-containing protein [Planctomycetota bacterium]
MTRRRFLSSSAAAACVGACAGESPMLPAVDTHQHLWDLSKLTLPWIKPGSDLSRNFVMKDYIEATAGLNVAKAVYMEVDVRPEDKLAEADYVVDLCKRKDNPTCAAVIGARVAEPGFRDYVARFKGSPYVKGVRQITGKPGQYVDDPFVKGVRLLGELGLSFDICTSPARLAEAAELVERCPDTRFVVDHCGNVPPKSLLPGGDRAVADAWRRDMGRLAKAGDRILCKLSGIVASLPRGKWTPADLAPAINACIETFGPDRCVWASDWPVCTRGATLAEWLTAFRAIIAPCSEPERKKLLHDNALRFYGLKDKS